MSKMSGSQDLPVTLHQGTSTMAKALVGEGVPEGVLLAHAWKRGAAYMLDNFVILSILFIATKGVFIFRLWNIAEMTTSLHITILHWIILLSLHWLYFKYTGKWMGRSLGQRWFGIALVHDDASPLGDAHWGRRSARKLVYALPLIGLVVFALLDYVRIRGDEKHQSRIDTAESTVAAVYWSLPWEARATMR
jgi:uncharacterized RDD family membrane protein YckC